MEAEKNKVNEQGSPIEILLVEDNEGDIVLTKEAFKESKLHNNLSIVKDGVEALSFLKKEGIYSDAPRPDIILLDLNLPKKTGFEVLHEIKNTPDLKTIPVVVLTCSRNEDDIWETYSKHANCYITKPVDFNKFINVIKSLNNFWLNIVKLPSAKEF
ncbi:MAG: response regulator [Spirochaetales bacterium]|nr:response regulator [Spirochaetales bacterium]